MKKLLFIFLTLIIMMTGCTEGEEQAPADDQATPSVGGSALVPKPLLPNAVTQNPYMASSENSVHNDSYSSDVSGAVLPLGINSLLDSSVETKNPQAPSAAFYDEYGAAVTPFNGGIAIADLTGDVITREGVFVPAIHDTAQYRVQISYSFVDSHNNVVLPTTHGHVIILKTRDGQGNVLPVFEKILDVNISEAAAAALGEGIDTRLLSVVYDYSGNLWFVTGGFRIVPERDPAGFLGYLSHEYIARTLAGESLPAADYLHFYKLTDGESAENGISSAEYGAVILTNKSCYLLEADSGVAVKWKADYESNGTNDALADSAYTGGGLAYGSGTTPTLTKDLVLFTDNLDPINLIAIKADDGSIAAKIPVLDGLGKDIPVSVENSILVYSGSAERISVIICNWFGAGNAGLSDPDADSSVQSYAALYDANWMKEGNKFIAPGVERVDVVKTEDGYKAEKVWLRSDVSDTAMIKLSTATGYLYGYWQNLDTGMWCYEVLDFDSGSTVYELPVSSLAPYNNVAVGMINDVGGNALYCPTNAMEMLVWQDRFVYLPETPAKNIAPHDMTRHYMTREAFKNAGGGECSPASYLMGVKIDNLAAKSRVAFMLNGLSGEVNSFKLFVQRSDGTLVEYTGDWSISDGEGNILSSGKLSENKIYEIRITVADGEDIDIDAAAKNVRISLILAK